MNCRSSLLEELEEERARVEQLVKDISEGKKVNNSKHTRIDDSMKCWKLRG